jgi:hypothetical protein
MRVLVALVLATTFLINAESLLFADSPEGYWTGLPEIDGDQHAWILNL